MKSIILFFILFSQFTPNTSSHLSDPKTIYYFCTSKILSGKEVKQYIYTEISSLQGTEENIQQRSNEWYIFVTKNCPDNNMKCTSDFNYYSTFEEAETKLKEMIKSISNRPDFKAEKVQF